MINVFTKTCGYGKLTVGLWVFLLLNCAPPPPAARIEGVNPAGIGFTNSADSNMCYDLGVYYYSRGELNVAMKNLKATIRRQPQHGESHALLGLIYEKKGKQKKAEKEFDAAARTLPTINEYRCQIAAFYKQMGMTHLLANNFGQAIGYLRKSIAVIPHDKDTQQLLAFSYCLMTDQCAAGNQSQLAADYYQKARMLYPALPQQRRPEDISVWPDWVKDNFPR
jgi:Tfp pilus assembly protein PilF